MGRLRGEGGITFTRIRARPLGAVIGTSLYGECPQSPHFREEGVKCIRSTIVK
jgi:hypothetical protein